MMQIYKSFYDHIGSFSNYRSILCLNGALPSAGFFSMAKNLPIIAADGAAIWLMKEGILPEITIGDLDSFAAYSQSLHRDIYRNIKTLHVPDQSSCDFDKSLSYIKDEELFPSIIVGIDGGHLDHVLNNINIFVNSDNIFFAPPIVGYSLSAGQSKIIRAPVNTKISILGMPNAEVDSTGLKWELKGHLLNFPGGNSCFNRTIEAEVKLEVKTGTALILVYLEDIVDAGIG